MCILTIHTAVPAETSGTVHLFPISMGSGPPSPLQSLVMVGNQQLCPFPVSAQCSSTASSDTIDNCALMRRKIIQTEIQSHSSAELLPEPGHSWWQKMEQVDQGQSPRSGVTGYESNSRSCGSQARSAPFLPWDASFRAKDTCHQWTFCHQQWGAQQKDLHAVHPICPKWGV